MQRFFFHFVSQAETICDERGMVLSSLAAAHFHAMKLVRELVPVLPEADRRKWRIEIGQGNRDSAIVVLFPVSMLALQPIHRSHEIAFGKSMRIDPRAREEVPPATFRRGS